MATAAQFRLDLADFAEREIPEFVTAIVQKFSMEALSRVVLRSPVDTGRFRGNWTVSIGAPVMTTTEATDQSGQSAISSGSRAIMAMREPRVVYVQNNLPYGPRLENGWSLQAPAGMVAVTFADLQSVIA